MIKTLAEMERNAIAAALARNHGNKPQAAAELGICLKTLYNKLSRLVAVGDMTASECIEFLEQGEKIVDLTPRVHDHFDGSANCVDCCGACRLEGPMRWLTEMVRWRFESMAYKRSFNLSYLEQTTLHAAGVEIAAYFKRANESREKPLIDTNGTRVKD